MYKYIYYYDDSVFLNTAFQRVCLLIG